MAGQDPGRRRRQVQLYRAAMAPPRHSLVHPDPPVSLDLKIGRC
jgi:hypothetical protein